LPPPPKLSPEEIRNIIAGTAVLNISFGSIITGIGVSYNNHYNTTKEAIANRTMFGVGLTMMVVGISLTFTGLYLTTELEKRNLSFESGIKVRF
jgi:hypothetical protein